MIEDGEKVQNMQHSIQQTWANFALKKRLSAKKKWYFWCRMRIDDMPNPQNTLEERLAQHVIDMLCLL
jgi:hypothetical protein